MIQKTRVLLGILLLAGLSLFISCSGKKDFWYQDMIEETGSCTELQSAIDLSIGGFKKGRCPNDFVVSCQVEQKIAGQSLEGKFYYYKKGAFESVDVSVMEEACKKAGGKVQKNTSEEAEKEN